jgi:mannose-6-phosphate isomerase-like protein (cupin superfamily)
MTTSPPRDLQAMTKGWFIGPFLPTAFHTDLFECAIKRYAAGEREGAHVHRVATEFTVIVEGSVRMNQQVYGRDQIIEIKPGEATDFEALTDTITVVVKVPAVAGDKYAC